jgi:hypothetical protein
MGTTTFFRWDSLRHPSSVLLDEPVLAAAPVSPVARRAPGRGAWGHEPLTGAQVGLLAVTENRVAVLTLDRDVGGPYLYRPLRVEIVVPRSEVRGVRLGALRPSRRFTIVLEGGVTWPLEVSTWGRRGWGPVLTQLGQVGPGESHARAETSPDGHVVSSDAGA